MCPEQANLEMGCRLVGLGEGRGVTAEQELGFTLGVMTMFIDVVPVKHHECTQLPELYI